MNTLLTILLIGGLPASGVPTTQSDAMQVESWDFGAGMDANFDRWPDGWTRLAGVAYPRYLKIEISQEPSVGDERCLRMELNGGAATVFSPKVPIGSQFSYLLESSVKTEQLLRDVAYVSLFFYDSEGKPVETHTSQRVQTGSQWQQVRIGPVTPSREEIKYAVVGLHLEPRHPRRVDLKGAALFDAVWLGRLPRMTLRSKHPHNVFCGLDDVAIICEASGIPERDPLVTFELTDAQGEILASTTNRLQGQMDVPSPNATGTGGTDASESSEFSRAGYSGSASWSPPIRDYGFYRVRATMSGSNGVIQHRETTLVVIGPPRGRESGEFGWSLPQGDEPLALGPLADLLGKAGVNWVKFPVWYSEQRIERADQLARFIERLNGDGIQVVGMLDRPPPDVLDRFADSDHLLAATIFAEPRLWHPVLNPIMTRLSLKVRWWQLGGDDDASFIGHPQLHEKIREVKQQIERFGQEVNLGLGWKWLYEPPASSDSASPFVFLSYNSDPPMTPTELAEYLSRTRTGNVQRWTMLEPLANGTYNLHDRARDLVSRMLAAKRAGADCVFVPNPFDPHHGLMNPDGTPGPLLLPWRTTSQMISGTQFVGSIAMPGGSQNYVFADGREAIMVVWNERPTQEILYLGDHVEQIDLWGRVTTPESDGHRQVIEVSPTPTFITGVHLPIARWRMSFQFDRRQLSSVFGRPQTAFFEMKNEFDYGVGGEVRIVVPDVWDIEPPSHQVRLATGEQVRQAFQVELKPNASSGPQDLRVDFRLTADKNYRFSVYRPMDVGLGDVVVGLNTHLNEKGELVVQQSLVNKTDEFVSFNCLLFAPQRRHMRRQVIDQPRGRSVQTYVLPNGRELVGESLWLRAEEIGGDRVLSYRVRVEE